MLLLGPIFIAVTFALNVLRIEPFATFFYLCAWCGLIFTFDQWIRAREGRSLIAHCGLGGFAFLLLWSAVLWYFFELLNFRLQNWYYVFVVDDDLTRKLFSMLSFATVFPGIFWIEHYLFVRGVAAGAQGKQRSFSPWALYFLQFIGLLFVLLPMVWPTHFFPLIWGALVLFCAPINYRRGLDGLLRQLERGEYGPLLRILLAGMLAGLLWESLNYWARAKWIYTVPFFEQFKLFEMPLLGFVGFPPFALECAVLYRLLVYERLAPAFGGYCAQKEKPFSRRVRGLLVVLALLFALCIEHYSYLTLASTTPHIAKVQALDATVRARLKERGVRYLTDLEGWYGRDLWRSLKEDLSEKEYARLERLTRLYLHQGIGVDYGNMLVRVGIDSLEKLGQMTDEQVLAKLSSIAHEGELPPAVRVRVWIRRARSAL
jgi:hypothetical protein